MESNICLFFGTIIEPEPRVQHQRLEIGSTKQQVQPFVNGGSHLITPCKTQPMMAHGHRVSSERASNSYCTSLLRASGARRSPADINTTLAEYPSSTFAPLSSQTRTPMPSSGNVLQIRLQAELGEAHLSRTNCFCSPVICDTSGATRPITGAPCPRRQVHKLLSAAEPPPLHREVHNK